MFKSCGIIRKVDELGRYTLPMELRRVLHIQAETMVEIYNENEYVVISNIENRIAIHKEIDKLGRVVIPMELRRKLGIEDGVTSLEVFLGDNKIYLKKYQSGCIFCGELKNKTILGKAVCVECAKKIGEMYGA